MMGAMLRHGFGPPVVWLVVVAVLSAGGCQNGRATPSGLATVERTIVLHEPTALVAEPSGGLLVAEQRLGRVRRIFPDGVLDTEPVATVDVVHDGRRGLLGLAEDGAGDIYAAWTRAPDGRLVVGRVGPGDQRLVWVGPESAVAGGSLVLRDDRLIVAVGGRQASDGKLLSLDPAGPPDQRPEVVGSGWNDPVAMTVLRSGEIWVADRASGRGPERLGRGDGATAGRTGDLPGRRRPAALVELADGRLAVCGSLTDDLQVVEPRKGGRDVEVGPVIVDRCRTSAVMLGHRLLAVATDVAVLVVSLPR